jgi:multidrug efflux pump subunit AcrA (membrane-fusion protein)
MEKKKIITIGTVLVIVAALIFIPPVLASARRPSAGATESSVHVFSVRTESAEIRTLQAHLEVNANIVTGNQVTVLPEANGRLVSMRVSLGSNVYRGQLIAEVDPSRPGADYSISAVYAPVSGTVVSSPVSVGSTVSTGTVLLTMAVVDSIEIVALIPEREVGQLRTGLSAEIRLEAFPSEIFAATLTQISPVVDPVSRTKRTTLRFDQMDRRINSGMFARVRLNTRTYENVVSIPQEALVEHRGRTIVYVLKTDDDGTSYAEMREVAAGVNINREVEIRNGLEVGDAVVVQGQQFLADGVQVRVIGSR